MRVVVGNDAELGTLEANAVAMKGEAIDIVVADLQNIGGGPQPKRKVGFLVGQIGISSVLRQAEHVILRRQFFVVVPGAGGIYNFEMVAASVGQIRKRDGPLV